MKFCHHLKLVNTGNVAVGILPLFEISNLGNVAVEILPTFEIS